jgi:hypothetical protein
VQTQSTTSNDTRRCSRCKNTLPTEAFGSHNYCRACYREYLDNWHAKNTKQPTRRQVARQRLKDGHCLVCNLPDTAGELCAICYTALVDIGIESDDFENNLLNILDHYNGVFDK